MATKAELELQVERLKSEVQRLQSDAERLKQQIQYQKTLKNLGITTKVSREICLLLRNIVPWVTTAYVTIREGDSFRDSIVALARENLGLASLCGMLAVIAVAGIAYGHRQRFLRRRYMDRNDDFRRLYEP